MLYLLAKFNGPELTWTKKINSCVFTNCLKEYSVLTNLMGPYYKVLPKYFKINTYISINEIMYSQLVITSFIPAKIFKR